MEVVIVTPERELFRGAATLVSFRAEKGDMEIMPGHAPLLVTLSKGDLRLESDRGNIEYKILSGFAEVHNDEATLLVRESVSEEEE